MESLATAEKQQERVIVQAAVSLQRDRDKAASVGERVGNLLAVQVEPRPGRTARARESGDTAGRAQQLGEVRTEHENTQIPFAVHFGTLVASGVTGGSSRVV